MENKKVLVFWLDTKETSILSESALKVKKNRKGEKISDQAKWEGKFYDVKIIAENASYEFLSSLEVSDNGEIMRASSSQASTSVLAEKRRKRQELKELNKKRKEVQDDMNASILSNKSIFDDDESSESESEDTILVDGDEENNAEKFDEDDEDDEGDEGDEDLGDGDVIKNKSFNKGKNFQKVSSKSNSTNKNHPSCLFCIPLNEGGSIAEKITLLTQSFLSHLKSLVGDDENRQDEIQLSPLSDVRINRYKLNDLLRLCEGKRKKLLRGLFLHLVGEENLASLSASTIPENIFVAVENYVNSDVLKGKRINLKEFKRITTNFCGSRKVAIGKKKQEESSNLETSKKENHSKSTSQKRTIDLSKTVQRESQKESGEKRTAERSPTRTSQRKSQNEEIEKKRSHSFSEGDITDSSKSIGFGRSRSSSLENHESLIEEMERNISKNLSQVFNKSSSREISKASDHGEKSTEENRSRSPNQSTSKKIRSRSRSTSVKRDSQRKRRSISKESRKITFKTKKKKKTEVEVEVEAKDLRVSVEVEASAK